MSARIPWTQRKWTFVSPVDLYPDILERLRGTPARIEDLLAGMSAPILTQREREGTWSIQENIGHLIDLDDLHAGRIDDFLTEKDVLRAADMTNTRTHTAGHNARPFADIRTEFRKQRGHFLARLESLTPEDFARTSTHPRLKVAMRLVDMCHFTADHDDYHLARMRELRRLFAGW